MLRKKTKWALVLLCLVTWPCTADSEDEMARIATTQYHSIPQNYYLEQRLSALEMPSEGDDENLSQGIEFDN